MIVGLFPIDLKRARAVIERVHYSHAMPSTFDIRAWGAFDMDTARLLCVVTTSAATNAHGVAAKFGLNTWRGNIEISRIAALEDAPRNIVSLALSLTVKREHEVRGVDWLFSYSDTAQDHHGGVYQAVNAVYVGVSGGRSGYLMDGKPVHPRSLVQRYGTHEWPLIQRLVVPHILVRVRLGAKHTYILLAGPRRKAIRRHLDRYALPYPKRTDPEHVLQRALAVIA